MCEKPKSTTFSYYENFEMGKTLTEYFDIWFKTNSWETNLKTGWIIMKEKYQDFEIKATLSFNCNDKFEIWKMGNRGCTLRNQSNEPPVSSYQIFHLLWKCLIFHMIWYHPKIMCPNCMHTKLICKVNFTSWTIHLLKGQRQF